jgi:membrane protease YdiL (CAAX protease family)
MSEQIALGRVRRLLRHPWALLLVKLILVIAPVVLLVTVVRRGHYVSGPVQDLVEAPGALLSLALFALYTRHVEGRAVGELTLRRAPRELVLGFAAGMAAISSVIAVLAALGLYRIESFNAWSALLLPLLSAVGAAIFEELLFRGILFRIAEDSLGSWWAIALSALFFGAAHLTNPHATALAAVAVMIEASLFLSAAYMLTRRLWFPIGIHAGWNFTEEGIWGVSVSGTTPHGLTQSYLHGPVWLSGGEFGAEASLVAIVICGSIGVLLIRQVALRGGLVAPFWRRRFSAASASTPLR